MNRIKVLMIGPGDPSLLNSGLGKAAQQIAERLSNLVSLTILQPEKIIDSVKEKDRNGSERQVSISDFSDFKVISDMIKIEVSNTISSYWYGATNLSGLTPSLEVGEIQNKLSGFTKELLSQSSSVDFDVIYAHDWLTFGAAMQLKDASKKPLVLHVHSLDYDRSSMHTGSWVFQLEKEAFNKADQIICVSNYSKKIIEEVYDIKSTKIHVVYNGYSSTNYPKVQSPFYERIVLFVGRLTGQKGPTQFLSIAEEVNELYPNSRFIMAGEGDMYKTLIESGAHSSVANKFHMTGYLKDTDLKKLYAMSDVYCMPSVSEPFGLTALEAAGAELPVVISKNSGAAEVLDGARTVEFHDTTGFAREIVNLLKNEKLVNESVKRNSKSLQQLSWDQSVSKIVNILQNG